MGFKSLLAGALLGLVVTGCAHTVASEGALKPSTDWVANSPDWAAEVEQVYADATTYINEVAATKAKDSWAVVLDVDETVLNNVDYQIGLDLAGASYDEESWYNWTQKEEATLVPGAAEFIRHVNESGGHVVLITNRSDKEQFATESNLEALGLRRHYDFRVLLTRAKPATPSDKTTRFDLAPHMLAAQNYPNVEIVAYVGDGKGDKPSTPGDWKFFCIDQGAMYGEPCAAVPGSGV